MRRSAVGVLSAIFLASGLLTPAQADSTKVETKSVVAKEPLSSKQILAAEPKINEFIFDPTINLNLDQLNQALIQIEKSSLGQFTKIEIQNENIGILSFSKLLLHSESLVLSELISGLKIFGKIQPNQIFSITDLTPAKQQNPNWGLDRIDQTTGLDDYYDYDSTGSGVEVYVVDSGIDLDHEEFSNRIGNQFSFISNQDADSQNCGVVGATTEHLDTHGTHVAGIIGGSTFGVAKNVTINPVRVIGCDGFGNSAEIAIALDEIIQNHDFTKPAVINMSLGGPYDPALNAAVARAVAAGITVVVASGNDGTNPCALDASLGGESPASAQQAITVNASTLTGNSIDDDASFSNYGSCTDIYAPGENIESAWAGGGSGFKSGTSMAAPMVTGVAARILSENLPTILTPAQVWAEIQARALTINFTPELQSDARLMLNYQPELRLLRNSPLAPFTVGTFYAGETIQVILNESYWDSGVTFTYQWKLNNSPIQGATSSTYLIPTSAGGSNLSVAVTGSKIGFQPLTLDSEFTTINLSNFSPSVPSYSVSHSSSQLIPGTTFEVSINPDVAGASVSYQWQKSANGVRTDIPGANSSTYRAQISDENHLLLVATTFSKTGYNSLTHTITAGFVSPPPLIDPPFPGSAIPATLKARKVLTINLTPGGTNSLGHPVSVYASGGCSAKGFTVTQTQNVPTLKKVKVREKYTTVDKRGKTVTKTRTVTQTKIVLVKKKVKVLGGYKVTMGKKGTSCQLTTIVNGTNPYKTSSRVNTISVT